MQQRSLTQNGTTRTITKDIHPNEGLHNCYDFGIRTKPSLNILDIQTQRHFRETKSAV